jgi:hypothetical protein
MIQKEAKYKTLYFDVETASGEKSLDILIEKNTISSVIHLHLIVNYSKYISRQYLDIHNSLWQIGDFSTEANVNR